jgi:hypothetical protein
LKISSLPTFALKYSHKIFILQFRNLLTCSVPAWRVKCKTCILPDIVEKWKRGDNLYQLHKWFICFLGYQLELCSVDWKVKAWSWIKRWDWDGSGFDLFQCV